MPEPLTKGSMVIAPLLTNNQPTFLFTVRMPFRILRHADLAKRFGFLTNEEARGRYPKQGRELLRFKSVFQIETFW